MINNHEFKLEFNYTNPYRDSGLGQEVERVVSPFEWNQTLADRVVYWAKAILYRDYERHLEIADKGAYLLDKGVTVVIGGLQGATILDSLFHLNIVRNGPLSFVPTALKVVLVPASIALFILGIIEAIFEMLNMLKGVHLLKEISEEQSPMGQLDLLKKRYFSLEIGETDRIKTLIEEKLPHLNRDEKAVRFDQIAQKALHVKFENLKRRVSPGLADEVKNQLNLSIKRMQCGDPTIQAQEAKRVELLMKSVSDQAKTKILIHVLGLIAIICTVISALSMFTGFGMVPLTIALGAITAIAVLTKFAVQKKGYDQQADNFKARVKTIELSEASAAS